MSAPFDIRPVSGFIGAEIAGIDLDEILSEAQEEALRQALYRYQVIFLRGQHLSLERQKAITEIFGPINRLPYVEPLPDDPLVIAVLKEADESSGGVFGGEWHSDFSFLERPPAGSVLSAVEIPPVGGDTVWSNQIAAFESLPRELKEIVEGREAIHVGAPYGVRHAPKEEERSGRSIRMTRGDPDADREIRHPAARPIPETGKRALFVNPIYTTRLSGMSEDESAPVLSRLYRHATRPDFSCRHRWAAGDVVVWDNRTTLHYATNDYDGHRRLLYRTTFGDRSV